MGCGIGFGYLHRIPKRERTATTGVTVDPLSSPQYQQQQFQQQQVGVAVPQYAPVSAPSAQGFTSVPLSAAPASPDIASNLQSLSIGGGDPGQQPSTAIQWTVPATTAIPAATAAAAAAAVSAPGTGSAVHTAVHAADAADAATDAADATDATDAAKPASGAADRTWYSHEHSILACTAAAGSPLLSEPIPRSRSRRDLSRCPTRPPFRLYQRHRAPHPRPHPQLPRRWPLPPSLSAATTSTSTSSLRHASWPPPAAAATHTTTTATRTTTTATRMTTTATRTITTATRTELRSIATRPRESCTRGWGCAEYEWEVD